MALKISKQVEAYGRTLSFPDAYARIESINGGKAHIEANVVVRDAKDGAVLSTIQAYFLPNLDGPNFIAQAYEHLKTLPEFEGAMDC